MPIDPICGATVSEESKFKAVYKGVTYYFCCEHCLARFNEDPERYVRS